MNHRVPIEKDQIWTADLIKRCLYNGSTGKSNIDWIERSILTLWKRQTAQERDSKSTFVLNHVGFSVGDVKYFSKIAEDLKKGRRLTLRRLVVVRKHLTKYCGQLAKIANKEV